MPKDFNQSTSPQSYLKLQWVYSKASINSNCTQDYLLKTTLLLVVGVDALTHKLSVLDRLQCVHDPQQSTA